MSFFTALSGLQAMQTDMATISHNLANVATTGFKKSRTQFADVISSSVATDPRKTIGSGVVVKGTAQQFKDGPLNGTSNALDLAVQGDGFFVVRSAGLSDQINYTRTGAFTIDDGGNVVDGQGSTLMVYPVDNDGNITATGQKGLTNLQIQKTSGTPKPTTAVSAQVNLSSTSSKKVAADFDRTDSRTYNNSVAQRVYDANGNAMIMTSYYVRTAEADSTATPPTTGTWDVHTFVGENPLIPTGKTTAAPVELKFGTTGALISPTDPNLTFLPFTPASGAAAQTISFDIAGSAQSSSAFSTNRKEQNGVPVGTLVGLTVDEAGLVKASYSNSDIVPLGKVALAKFSAPTGLRQVGGGYWQGTGLSGTPTLGNAAGDGFGALKSSSLEGSNVDITEELVNLIAAQRNFQANAKALDTASQVSQSILNIRN